MLKIIAEAAYHVMVIFLTGAMVVCLMSAVFLWGNEEKKKELHTAVFYGLICWAELVAVLLVRIAAGA